MNPTALTEKIRRHNQFQLTLGILLIPASVLAWFVSFWLFRWLFFIPLHTAITLIEWKADPWRAANWMAVAATALLAAEGLRRSRDLFDLKDYADSNFAGSGRSRSGGERTTTFALGFAYLVTQVLFMAPEATRHAILGLRSRLPDDPRTAEAAVRILDELAEHRRWVPRAKYADRAAAVTVLERLKLIWADNDEGLAQIRIVPKSDS